MQLTIIGSGIAGITLAEEFRKLNSAAAITVLTRESHGHYARPMLSHGFSREDVESKIILRTLDALAADRIDVKTVTEVVAVDREAHAIRSISAHEETIVTYETLVLATGSDAMIPDAIHASGCPFDVVNSLDDLVRLRSLRAAVQQSGRAPRIAIIGGGLIGCEVAADLVKAGDQVELFHRGNRLMERQLTEEDSFSLHAVLQNQGINISFEADVQGLTKTDTEYTVLMPEASASGFDAVIVACGFKPRIELARAAGLAVNRGILVDDYLRTGDQDIYAIGDCAEFTDGRIYAYIMPIRHQAQWLARHLTGGTNGPWHPPDFKPRAKVHGFTPAHPVFV